MAARLGPDLRARRRGRARRRRLRLQRLGREVQPYEDDAEVAARLLERLGEERIDARDFILEGGAIAVDGEGTLVTTEQCLLHPKRNPGLSKDEIARRLQHELGVHTVVWLGQGLVEDRDTDGHVDNICAFIAPGRVLLQTVADEANPNWETTRENAARLEAAGLEVVELPLLPYVDHDGPPTVVPYTNFYLCNGGVIVPVTGQETDDEALALLGGLYPGREVVAVPGVTLALGGGGVHCITQQIPAVELSSRSGAGVDVEVVDLPVAGHGADAEPHHRRVAELEQRARGDERELQRPGVAGQRHARRAAARRWCPPWW